MILDQGENGNSWPTPTALWRREQMIKFELPASLKMGKACGILLIELFMLKF